MTEILPKPLRSALTAKSGSASFQLFLPLEQHVRNVTVEVLVEELGAVRKSGGTDRLFAALTVSFKAKKSPLKELAVKFVGKALKLLADVQGCCKSRAWCVGGVSREQRLVWEERVGVLAWEDCCCVLTYCSGFQGEGPLSFWKGERRCCCSSFR